MKILAALLLLLCPLSALGQQTIPTSASFNPNQPNALGPGVAGTGALQTFTHPTGGSNNQYGEILLLGDPALTFDRHLFGICATVAGNNCVGQFYLGDDNDQNVVMSWSNTGLAIVGAQSEGEPLLLYTPTEVPSGNTFEFQQASLANSCIYFAACKNGNLFFAGGLGNGIIGCISNWDSRESDANQRNLGDLYWNNNGCYSLRLRRELSNGTTRTIMFALHD